MSEAQAVLLVESEQSVIKDLTCSLRLIDLPVYSAGSVLEAKSSVRSKRPSLVLVRSVVGDDPQAGVTLARELSVDQELGSLPVVLLCTPSEKSLLEGSLELFDAELNLPIEFPSVTYQIRDILKRFEKGKAIKDHALLDRVIPDTVERVAKAVALGGGAADGAVAADFSMPPLTPEQERNLHVAYRIQLAVLDELRRSRFFGKIGEDKVPHVVAAITNTVCQYFNDKQK